jgi:hypothetical protein
MMTIWNYIVDSSNSFFDKCENIYEYIKDYFYGHHDKWLFISGHSLPLSLNNLYNTIPTLWVYNNFNKSLSFNISTNSDRIRCKFAWLSAKIIIHYSEDSESAIEYNIDDFIENFILDTVDDYTPSLYTFFLCWCAHSKHWFKHNDIVEFHIIDNNGEEQVLSIQEHNDCLIIKHNKIYVVIESEEDLPQDNIVIEPSIDNKTEKSPLIQEKSSKED